MNCVTNIPNWTLYYLQQSNIKVRTLKVLDLSGQLVEISKDEGGHIVVKEVAEKVVEVPEKLNTI